MGVVSGEFYSVGARRAVIFALDVNGYPAATLSDGTPYEGTEVLGVKTFDLTVPGVRKISHVGNDRVLAFDFLPAIEGVSASMTVAGRDLGLDALLQGVTKVTLGESEFTPVLTDLQGYEPDVAVFICQQAKDAATRSRRYRFQIIPKSVIAVAPPGMNENPAESKYEISISPTTKHLWGHTFTVAHEGCLEAAVIEGMSEGRPNIIAWKGNASEQHFNFPASKQAILGKVHAVFVNGTILVPDVIAVDKITITAPPADGAMIVCIYEY